MLKRWRICAAPVPATSSGGSPTSTRDRVVHRPPAHRGRRPRPGGGRLAGADRRAVLPGDRRRPLGPQPPAPVHDGGRRPLRLPRRATRRPRLASRATGVPDPVLAEIGAARTGAMREIVATIQAEQDVVIRAPLEQCLVVQGGPGTGKTAVGLHRAAYLLFEHRRRLSRNGVLVVGPNSVFLDYIANVLPSLGERLVQQRTALDICVPKVDITGIDDDATRRSKGAPEMLERLATASVAHVVGPSDDLRLPIGARTLVVTAKELTEWVDEALHGMTPVNRRREGLKGLVQREMLRRTERDDVWERSPELRAAVARAWPTQQPIRMVDRLLPGPSGQATPMDRRRSVPRRRGQLDAQWNTVHVRPCRRRRGPGPLRCVAAGDRPAQPSGSMTILGDLAQSTTPAGQQDWNRSPGAHSCPSGRGCSADDRLSRARADPRCRQSPAALHRGRQRTEPQRASRRHRAGGARGHDRRTARRSRPRGDGRSSPPPQHRCRGAARVARRADRRALRGTACGAWITCTTWPTTTFRSSPPRP